MAANTYDFDRAARELSRLQQLVQQLRLQPEERLFYVPLILDFQRRIQSMLPMLEAENILESAVARVMRCDYTGAGIMLKSLAEKLRQDGNGPPFMPYAACR